MSTSNQKRIWPYLSDKMHRRYKAYCKTKGVSEGAVVEAALKQYFDGEDDTTILLRRLDRQSRALNRLQRDVEILSEALGSFVHIWFAHTPSLSDANKSTAQQHALSRYKDYLNYVGDQVNAGHKFVDGVVSDMVEEETF